MFSSMPLVLGHLDKMRVEIGSQYSHIYMVHHHISLVNILRYCVPPPIPPLKLKFLHNTLAKSSIFIILSWQILYILGCDPVVPPAWCPVWCQAVHAQYRHVERGLYLRGARQRRAAALPRKRRGRSDQARVQAAGDAQRGHVARDDEFTWLQTISALSSQPHFLTGKVLHHFVCMFVLSNI